MDINFGKAHKLISQIREELGKLANVSSASSAEISNLNGQLSASFVTLQTTTKNLDNMLMREINQTKRQIGKEKLSRLNEEVKGLEQEWNTLKKKHSEKVVSKNERNELLEQRNRSSLQRDQETTILMDHGIVQRESLDRASNRMDEFITLGQTVLQNLQQQQATLKGTRKKLLDIANQLGLSQHVIRLIERRSKEDTYILVAGIVITLLIMWLVIYYFL